MGVEISMALDVKTLDLMLINLLGGNDGDDLTSLFSGISKRVILDRIDDEIVSKRIRFVAHKPRGKNGTAICTGLDGSEYDPDDDSIPAIPQHFGCMSQFMFIGGAISGG